MSSGSADRDLDTRDGEILADLFDELLQEILEGRTPDLEDYLTERPDLRDRVAKTWALACSVAGRRGSSRPVLGGYEILRELGHGGMGTVYLAQHQILQREVAIKVLPHSLAMSPRVKQRFLEEAKALAQIRHNNVVHVHRVLDHTEMLAFEMEYIDGPSLQHVLQKLRTLEGPPTVATLSAGLGLPKAALGTSSPIEWFVRATIKIARALGLVHRHGLVHRDIKPSNILLRADGTPVLADFGLARLGEPGEGHTGDFAGTPVYAAPERLRGGDSDIGPRTDIYSLGVTLYELLTLNPPFSGKSTHEVLRHIESGQLPDLRQQAPHVSRDLATVVQKAMEADPRHRYATADEFADDLERLLAFEPIHARPAGPLRRTVKFLRRHRRVVTAGLVGAVVVAAASWPVVAHAWANEDRRIEARARLHAARTHLLSPESLHTAWTRAFAGESHQPLQHPGTREAHLEALEHVIAAYGEALALQPDDRAARTERDAVQSALAILRSRAGADTDAVAAIGEGLPLLAAVADRAAVAATAATVESALPLDAAPPEERFAAGLLAFLIGDSVASRDCWQQLGGDFADHPLLEACQALQLANDGFAERSYPRLFHATRAFPGASALALAMAGAALEMGDTEIAGAWLRRTQEQADNPIVQTRRRLLEADLLTANGEVQEAASIYRELSLRDVSDPMPRQRLAALALSEGNAATGRRLLHQILARWPDQALSRLRLAQLELQQRHLATYLGHVRYVLSQDLGQLSRAANQLAEIVRYGGLGDLLETSVAPTQPRSSLRFAGLPLANWLPQEACDAIRTALRVVATFDRAHESMRHVDPRPLGAALRATWISALSLPGLTRALPDAAGVALVAGIPALLGAPTDFASRILLPFQKILGNQALIVEPEAIVPFHAEPPGLAYASRVVRALDVDGDTLPDFCIANAATPSNPEGRVELRSIADGALLRTLRGGGEAVLFGHSLGIVPDFDGDRCDDLLIGSPADTATNGVGIVELRSGRTGERLWSRAGPTSGFGEALVALGDLDGDDREDFAVGAPSASATASGRVLLCSGRTGATIREFAAPPAASPAFGAVIANVGDVDGDGVGDCLVTGNPGGSAGLAVVYSGSDATILATFAEPSLLDDFGAGATGLGDINRDGHADFAITAPAYTGRTQRPGKVLVLDGQTGKLLYELEGERRGESFGMAICWLPHWLADDRAALAVSAFRGGPTGRGYVRIFDAATGQPLQTLAANTSVILFGQALVDLGDRDGDGLRDLGVPLILADQTCGMWSVSFAMTRVR